MTFARNPEAPATDSPSIGRQRQLCAILRPALVGNAVARDCVNYGANVGFVCGPAKGA
jgi:hypothetical protein